MEEVEAMEEEDQTTNPKETLKVMISKKEVLEEETQIGAEVLTPNGGEEIAAKEEASPTLLP